MAPGQDGEWVDTAGCNDCGKRQFAALHDELNGAEQLAVVVETNLQNSADTSRILKLSQLPAMIARVAAAGQVRTDNCMMVIHNRENMRGLAHKLLGQARLDGDQKKAKKRGAESRAQLHNDILDRQLEGLEKEGVKKVLDLIPMLHPAVSLLTSMVFREEAFEESEEARQNKREARQKLLDSTGGYELLGTLEMFLKAGSRAWVEELFRKLDGTDGLLAALMQVKRNQESVATAAVKKRDLVKAWKGEKVKLDSMRDEFKGCLATIANAFFKKLAAEVNGGSFKQLVRDEFERTCTEISQRPPGEDVPDLDSYCTNLKSVLWTRLMSRVGNLQKDLVDDFQPVVQKEILSFVDGQLSSLNLPGGYKARIEEIKTMTTSAVKIRFYSKGFGKVVHEHFQRIFKRVWGKLRLEFQADVNKLEDGARSEYLAKANFEGQLVKFEDAAASVVLHLKRSLACWGGDEYGAVILNFMQQLDVVPLRTEIWIGRGKKKGAGSTIQLLGDLAKRSEALLFENMTSRWLDRDEERLRDLTSLHATLKNVVDKWEAATQVLGKEIGKDLFEDFRSSRIMDQYNVTRFGSSSSAPLLDETPSQANIGKHNIHKGHLPIVGSEINDASGALLRIWTRATDVGRDWLGQGNVSKLNEALKNNTRGKLGFVVPGEESEPDGDEFLTSYLMVALGYSLEEVKEAVKGGALMDLRRLILLQAARSKEYASVLLATHGGLDGFKDFILDGSKCPDLLALCFLSEFFKRRLNLYVPWNTRVSTDQDDPHTGRDLIPKH